MGSDVPGPKIGEYRIPDPWTFPEQIIRPDTE